MDLDGFVLIGKIVGAHGIRGAVKVYSEEEASVEIYKKGLTVLLVDDRGKAAHHTIQWSEPYKKGFRIAFNGICDRNASEAIIGARLYIDEAEIPPLEKGTYYWSDLIGLAVHDVKAGYIGQISSIMPTAGHDVYIVQDPDKGANYEVLIPALASVVIDVDLEQQMMQVDVPEGLMPDMLNPEG
jgi:16S rRNA processing protein RimM